MTGTKRVSTRSPRRLARYLATDETGSVAIEMGLTSIFFVTLLTGIISFGSLYFVQGNMSDAARDTARRVATGELTPEQAQTHAEDALVNWGMNYTVIASNNGTEAAVEISVPMSQAAFVDFLGILTGTLRARVTLPAES